MPYVDSFLVLVARLLKAESDSILPIAAGQEAALLSFLQEKQVDSLYYLTADQASPTQLLYEYFWALQQAELRGVISMLGSLGVEIITLKGVETTKRYMGSKCLGVRSDMDVIIPPDKILECCDGMKSLGYLQSKFDSYTRALVQLSLEEISYCERNSISLSPFGRLVAYPARHQEAFSQSSEKFPARICIDGIWYACIIVDMSTGLDKNFIGLELESLLIPSAHQGCKTLKPSVHAWYMIAQNYYRYAFASHYKLRPLVDIAQILYSGIDSPLFMKLCDSTHTHCAAYYYVEFLSRTGLFSFPDMVEHLDPRRRSRSNDFGWQISKYFNDIDVFPGHIA